eukprot:SM000188S03793  [mRNA]  locus=s188:17651:18649:+ [translate_table: standard]
MGEEAPPAAPASAAPAPPVFTMDQVYDVTKFLDEHPGGDEVMLSSTGKDATDDFEDVGHSTSARKQLNQYYIGELDPSSLPERAITKSSMATVPSQATGNTSFITKILQFLVPIAILALAIAVRVLTKKEPIDAVPS